MDTLSPAQDDSSGANPSSVKSDDSSPQHESGRSSPPPKCAICLGTCRNKSFTDSCLHQFCFKCLLTWSKVKAECPLCKQNFRSIIHNVRSNHQYEEYMVEQRQTDEIADRIEIDNITTATRRFRYRTTLTLPRRETIAIQQLLLHYPMMADVFPPPAHRRRSPASFRRTVYRYNLWARPLPDFTGRFRDCSPEFYRYNDSQMHRLVPWLNRELHYLLNENIGHISYVIARILELLPQYHINSSEFRETLQRYFGDRTEHFLHELYCFASTPYDMTGYDRNVQYTTDTRVSTMVNEVISSSESEASADSDIVMISSSEPADPPPGPSRAPAPARVPAPVYPQNYIPEPTADNVIPIETISQSDTDDDSSEVMVVGYIKPPQDRTPEVVDLLGSDSDVIVQENAPAEPPGDTTDGRPTPLVKLTLKRQVPDSDSDSAYTPSPSPPRPRRRLGSAHSASTADTRRTTPSRDDRSSVTSYASTSSSPASSSSTNPSSDSDCSRTENKRKKSRRRIEYTERNRRKQKKLSHRRTKKSPNTPAGREKRSKRKSHSGKGVKSTKKSSEAVPATACEEPPLPNLDQPGTSGTSRNNKRKLENNVNRRRLSRESKRLRSVVNVINSQKNSGESSCSSKCSSTNRSYNTNNFTLESEAKPDDTDRSTGSSARGMVTDYSDSEDDLPLNLSIANAFSSL
ncbi:E3 ubiquitin-protein ligase Topors [Vanessa tameamea]|uniref:RING-type E3 ubiquitin transferase n=1 Tax=Vanessa tameamea TaxID=334116 RepID=A0A8B8ILE2_VANTA